MNLASVLVEHRFAGATLRNRTMAGDYSRSYQNYVPGAATADAAQVATHGLQQRHRSDQPLQPDRPGVRGVRPVACATRILTGAEFGGQSTDNFRNTGFFNNTATSILVPFADPTITTPVTFRQSATDADNHVRNTVAAGFVQDQVEVSPLPSTDRRRAVRPLRHLDIENHRDGTVLSRTDNLVSPRAGLVIKPTRTVSLYSSYGVSYLPGSGDQFSSLTLVTQQLKPEQFTNYEFGAKWDRAQSLALTTAVYRLDRTNTRSTDPNDPTRIIQTGSQRTNGFELGASGQVTSTWKVAGGYAYQDAFVTSATAAAALAMRRSARCRTTPSRCGTTTSSIRAWPPRSALSTAATCSWRSTTR